MVQNIITPAELNAPSMLPASLAEQIQKARIKAALLGQAPAAWAAGAPCQAVWSADGKYYNAMVDSVTEAGTFFVVFEGYGDKEEVGGSVAAGGRAGVGVGVGVGRRPTCLCTMHHAC